MRSCSRSTRRSLLNRRDRRALRRPLPTCLGRCGQIAFIVTAVVLASFYVRGRMGQRTWRLLHWLAFAAFAAATVHGLRAGTDTAEPWAWAIYAGATSIVVFVLATGWSSPPRCVALGFECLRPLRPPAERRRAGEQHAPRPPFLCAFHPRHMGGQSGQPRLRECRRRPGISRYLRPPAAIRCRAAGRRTTGSGSATHQATRQPLITDLDLRRRPRTARWWTRRRPRAGRWHGPAGSGFRLRRGRRRGTPADGEDRRPSKSRLAIRGQPSPGAAEARRAPGARAWAKRWTARARIPGMELESHDRTPSVPAHLPLRWNGRPKRRGSRAAPSTRSIDGWPERGAPTGRRPSRRSSASSDGGPGASRTRRPTRTRGRPLAHSPALAARRSVAQRLPGEPPSRHTALFRRPGVVFDLDPIRRGWLADRALALLADAAGALVEVDGAFADPGRGRGPLRDPCHGPVRPPDPLAIFRLEGPRPGFPAKFGFATAQAEDVASGSRPGRPCSPRPRARRTPGTVRTAPRPGRRARPARPGLGHSAPFS